MVFSSQKTASSLKKVPRAAIHVVSGSPLSRQRRMSRQRRKTALSPPVSPTGHHVPRYSFGIVGSAPNAAPEQQDRKEAKRTTPNTKYLGWLLMPQQVTEWLQRDVKFNASKMDIKICSDGAGPPESPTRLGCHNPNEVT